MELRQEESLGFRGGSPDRVHDSNEALESHRERKGLFVRANGEKDTD
jgi:hypothetical protein